MILQPLVSRLATRLQLAYFFLTTFSMSQRTLYNVVLMRVDKRYDMGGSPHVDLNFLPRVDDCQLLSCPS